LYIIDAFRVIITAIIAMACVVSIDGRLGNFVHGVLFKKCNGKHSHSTQRLTPIKDISVRHGFPA
jgi:hypothetical protein